MHSPRPYGLLVKGGETTDGDIAFIEAVVHRFTNFKSTGKLSSLKMQYDLPDGGWFIVQDMGGTFRVIVNKSENEPPPKLPTGFAEDFIPMFFSGVIRTTMVKNDEGVTVGITDQCRRRLMLATGSELLPPKDLVLQRFKIEYSDDFAHFRLANTGIYTVTQFHRHRPTWYSGSMCALMQIIGGYGRLDFENLPDDPIELAQMVIPNEYKSRIDAEISNLLLAGYTGFPNQGGQFKYDYRFSKTSCVAFGEDKEPWLLEVSPSGVYVMPLPVVPSTKTKAFREYIESVGDSEILAILDKFGALPTGEGFPTEREAWMRAGVVVKLCDTSEFYSNIPFYEACGWAFNSLGSEGFNTCWNWVGQLKEAYGYKLSIKIGELKNGGNAPSVTLSQSESQALGQYLSDLTQRLGRDQQSLAILYKLRTVPKSEILSRLGRSGESEVVYWHNYVAAPIAVATANINRVSSGKLFIGHGAQPNMQSGLKFPVLSGQGTASFDLSTPDYEGEFVRCDTVVFGCYVEDQLRVIKYFIDDRKFTKSEQSTFEEYMYVGSWEKRTWSGSTGLMGNFYTTDFDDRTEQSPTTSYTRVMGNDLGYGGALYTTPQTLYVRGSVSRARYYRREEITESVSGNSLNVAVCVPVFARDAILYAKTESSESETRTRTVGRGAVGDPNSYELWTYDPAFHFMWGGGKGEPAPTIGDYVYVDKYTYSPSPSNDFADSGNWLGLANGSYIDVSHICAPYTIRGNSHGGGVSIGGGAPYVEPVDEREVIRGKSSGSVSVSLDVAGAKQIHSKMPMGWYFTFSPILVGNQLEYFYRDACWVAFGGTKYSTTSETDNNGYRYRWGACSLVLDNSSHHFIGVINE